MGISSRSIGCAVSMHRAVSARLLTSARNSDCSMVSAAPSPSCAPIWRETSTAAPVVTTENSAETTAITVLDMPMAASALALMVLMMRENRSPMKIVSTFSATTGNVNRKERLSSLLTARRGFFM